MNDKEKVVLSKMIRIYCRSKHHCKDVLCRDCQELEQYAYARLECCKFGEEKPTCKKCPIHCYKKDMKEKIQIVMRFSGPRMIFYSPMSAISHFLKK